jgi:hypothetical protein
VVDETISSSNDIKSDVDVNHHHTVSARSNGSPVKQTKETLSEVEVITTPHLSSIEKREKLPLSSPSWPKMTRTTASRSGLGEYEKKHSYLKRQISKCQDLIEKDRGQLWNTFDTRDLSLLLIKRNSMNSS